MNTLEHETENQDEEMADNSDSGKKSPSSSETLTSSSTSAIKREMDSENENENEVMNNTETKNMEDNKENIADKSKCSKCLVSTWKSYLNFCPKNSWKLLFFFIVILIFFNFRAKNNFQALFKSV